MSSVAMRWPQRKLSALAGAATSKTASTAQCGILRAPVYSELEVNERLRDALLHREIGKDDRKSERRAGERRHGTRGDQRHLDGRARPDDPFDGQEARDQRPEDGL